MGYTQCELCGKYYSDKEGHPLDKCISEMEENLKFQKQILQDLQEKLDHAKAVKAINDLQKQGKHDLPNISGG